MEEKVFRVLVTSGAVYVVTGENDEIRAVVLDQTSDECCGVVSVTRPLLLRGSEILAGVMEAPDLYICNLEDLDGL